MYVGVQCFEGLQAIGWVVGYAELSACLHSPGCTMMPCYSVVQHVGHSAMLLYLARQVLG